MRIKDGHRTGQIVELIQEESRGRVLVHGLTGNFVVDKSILENISTTVPPEAKPTQPEPEVVEEVAEEVVEKPKKVVKKTTKKVK